MARQQTRRSKQRTPVNRQLRNRSQVRGTVAAPTGSAVNAARSKWIEIGEALSEVNPKLRRFSESYMQDKNKEDYDKGRAEWLKRPDNAEEIQDPSKLAGSDWFRKGWMNGKGFTDAMESSREIKQMVEDFNPEDHEDPQAALSATIGAWKEEKLSGLTEEDEWYRKAFVDVVMEQEAQAHQKVQDETIEQFDKERREQARKLAHHFQTWGKERLRQGDPAPFLQWREAAKHATNLTREELNMMWGDTLVEFAREGDVDFFNHIYTSFEDGVDLRMTSDGPRLEKLYNMALQNALTKEKDAIEGDDKAREEAAKTASMELTRMVNQIEGRISGLSPEQRYKEFDALYAHLDTYKDILEEGDYNRIVTMIGGAQSAAGKESRTTVNEHYMDVRKQIDKGTLLTGMDVREHIEIAGLSISPGDLSKLSGIADDQNDVFKHPAVKRARGHIRTANTGDLGRLGGKAAEDEIEFDDRIALLDPKAPDFIEKVNKLRNEILSTNNQVTIPDVSKPANDPTAGVQTPDDLELLLLDDNVTYLQANSAANRLTTNGYRLSPELDELLKLKEQMR